MKVHELFEAHLPQNARSRTLNRQQRKQQIGSGTTSRAYSTKEEPGTVTKRTHGGIFIRFESEQEARSHPNYIYLNEILQGGHHDNRYLPRVYDVDVYEKNDIWVVDVDMERLQPWGKITEKEAEVVAQQILHEPEKVLKQYVPNRQYYGDGLIKIVDWIVNGNVPTNVVKDSQFLQAAQFIQNLINRHKISNDIQTGNMAFRRGRHGPQLVFMDPVS